MKTPLLFIAAILISGLSFGQRIYDSFEPTLLKYVTYGDVSGRLKTDTANINMVGINMSSQCAKYIRADSIRYNYIKMTPDSVLDIRDYKGPSATKKIRMKVFTPSPVGSIVEINLGIKNTAIDPMDSSFSKTTDSQYRAMTSVQNAWEELVFDFILNIDTITPLSDTAINKIVIVFNPGVYSKDSSAAWKIRDTLYFDDLTGPDFYRRPVVVNSILSRNKGNYTLSQNYPNPASGVTTFNYSLNSPSHVTLNIYDLLGRQQVSLVNEKQNTGDYRFEYNTVFLSRGVYFYTLTAGGYSETKKMIVE